MLAQQSVGASSFQLLLTSSPSLHSNETWTSVEQLLSLVYALVQTVTLAAPIVQELVSDSIDELSQVGPTSDTLTLLTSHKLATALGMLLTQLNTMQQQQQVSTLLPTCMLHHMLADNLANDVRRSLAELQTVRKRSTVVAGLGLVQMQTAEAQLQSSQKRQQQVQQGSLNTSSDSASVPTADSSHFLAPFLQPLSLLPMEGSCSAKQQREPLLCAADTRDMSASLASDADYLQDQNQGVQDQPSLDFSEYYKYWDVPGLRLDAEAGLQSMDDNSIALGDHTEAASLNGPDPASDVLSLCPAPGSVPVMPLNVVDGTELIASELLGAGSFGSVRSGMWMGAPVAIKYLNSTTANSSAGLAVRQQLRKEVLLQAKCSHPNVVKFYAMCYNPPAIVMELCSGRSLAAGLQAAAIAVQKKSGSSSSNSGSGGRSSTQQLLLARTRVELLRQATSAVMCMHNQACLLHNDLRAANMLLDNTTGGWSLKVADFGLAVELKPGSCSATVKQTTNALWVAPEVLHGAGADGYVVTKASDVYSLGCVTYECLTGRIPLWDVTDEVAPDVRAMQVHLAASDGSPMVLQYPSKNRLLPCPETGYSHADAVKPLFDSCCSRSPDERPSVQRVHQWLRQLQLAPSADIQQTVVAHSPLEHPDLLAFILQRLPLQQRLRFAAMVNKQFAAAACKATFELRIKDLSVNRLEQLRRWCLRAGAGHITSLVVESIKPVQDVVQAQALVPWDQLSGLQSVSLPLIDYQMLDLVDWARLASTNLTSLQLKGFSIPGTNPPQHPFALMSQLSNLQWLAIDADHGGFAQHLVQEAYMPHLSALALQAICDDREVVAVGRFTGLQHLELTLHPNTQETSLQQLSTLSRLQDIKLHNLGSYGLGLAAEKLISTAFSHLTSLDLSRCGGVWGGTVDLSKLASVTQLTGLKCLLLGSVNANISPMSLSKISALTRLDAISWQLGTAAASESLLLAVGCLSKLRHLSLKGTELQKGTSPASLLVLQQQQQLTYLNMLGVLYNLDTDGVATALSPLFVRPLAFPCLQHLSVTPPKRSWLWSSPQHVAGLVAASPRLTYMDIRECLGKEALEGVEELLALKALKYLRLVSPRCQMPPTACKVVAKVANRRLQGK